MSIASKYMPIASNPSPHFEMKRNSKPRNLCMDVARTMTSTHMHLNVQYNYSLLQPSTPFTTQKLQESSLVWINKFMNCNCYIISLQ